jgi:hypothetical protein
MTALWYFEPNVRYLVNVLADTVPVAVVVRASVVPAVLRRRVLGKALPAIVTEELPCRAIVLVKFEFEFGAECSLAVPASVWHIVNILFSILKLHRNVHGWQFQF